MDIWDGLRIAGIILVTLRGWDFVWGTIKLWGDAEPRKWTRFGERGSPRGAPRRITAKALSLLWFFPIFCSWMSVLACLDAALHPASGPAGNFALLGLAVGLVLVNVLVCAEACVSFIRVGRWGSTYHGLPIGGEFPAAFGVGLTSLIGSVSLYFVVGVSEPHLLAVEPPARPLDALGAAAFRAFMTLAQASPPDATTPATRVAVAVVTLTGLAYLAVLVAMVAGAVGISPAPRVSSVDQANTSTPTRPQQVDSNTRHMGRAVVAAGLACTATYVFFRWVSKDGIRG